MVSPEDAIGHTSWFETCNRVIQSAIRVIQSAFRSGCYFSLAIVTMNYVATLKVRQLNAENAYVLRANPALFALRMGAILRCTAETQNRVVRCAFCTMDSAVLRLAPLGLGGGSTRV
jgi:hypothetical protein